MKIVIQCAARKVAAAGYMQTKNGEPVMFVAQPQSAPQHGNALYSIPDDFSDREVSWRTLLQEYNQNPGNNPLNLYPAYKLYGNAIYRALANRFGIEHTFILSAGWGMIRADFLTPQYDITFSPSAELYKRRKKTNIYQDFYMLPDDVNTPIVFFGGKDYIRLFCSITKDFRSQRTVFYNSEFPPEAPGCATQRFFTRTRTNWHYECAKAFLDGLITCQS
jgi:hypothetical protein